MYRNPRIRTSFINNNDDKHQLGQEYTDSAHQI